jgi:PKD repeat protein
MALRVPLYGLRADFTGPTGGTAQEPVTFTDLTNGADAWFWDFGDGSGSTAQNPTHTYLEVGVTASYSVKLTASKNNIIAGVTRKENFIEIAPVGLDPDAAAFLNATGITDNTITSAIDQLVVDLKDAGIWSRIDAAYPFVGGTASTCKYNLKDPRDLNAAFRLDFNGSWTIGASGAAPTSADSSNYADTFWDTSVGGGRNDIHHVYRYLLAPVGGCGYGGIGGAPYLIVGHCGTIEWFSGGAQNSGGGDAAGSAGYSQGLNRKTSTSVEFSRKLVGESWTIFTTNSTAVGTITANTSFYIGTINGANFPEASRYTFLSLGQDLTTQQMADLDDIVTTFNTSLNRNF